MAGKSAKIGWMKISVCSVAFRNEPADIFSIIDIIAGIGYKSIEIWGNHLVLEKFDKNFVKKLNHRLEFSGVDVSMISPYFNFTTSKESAEKSINHSKLIFEYASNLKCPLVRVFTGVTGSKEATVEQYERCLRGVREVALVAKEYGLKLAVETHPNTLVDTPESSKKFIESVAMENVGLNLDIYHMWEIRPDPVAIYLELESITLNIHAKNAKLTNAEKQKHPHLFLHGHQAKQKFYGIVNLENGDMEYDDFLLTLKERDFEGPLSIEWFGDNPTVNIAKELNYVRKILSV